MAQWQVGQGTSSITVDWGGTGMTGQVMVVENNGCTDGAPVTLDVLVGPLPTSAISGMTSAAAGEEGLVYSVCDPGYTYTWSISTEGTITSGQGTNMVTVDWNSAGTGILSVVGSNSCGNASQVDLVVEFMMYL